MRTAIALLIVLLASSVIASPLRRNPTWDIRTNVAPDAEAGGWFINLGLTGARGKIETDAPTVMEVTYVYDDTPASGRLAAGDRIVGANGTRWTEPHRFGYGMGIFGYDGPMMSFGNALEAAQADDGVLRLMVERGDDTLLVEIPIGTEYGAYGAAYPFDCEKTTRVLAETCAYLASRQGDDGHWHRGRPHIDVFAALALLGSGDAEYRGHVDRAAWAFAQNTNDVIDYGGLDCWKYTLYGIFLAEYYLATEQAWVIPELEEINRWLEKAQMEDGGWGHRPANRPGGNGYGSFAAMTAQGQIAWGLMRKCGIDVDSERYARAHAFVQGGTNDIGYVWYKNESAHPTNYADMGRTGTAAVANMIVDDEAHRAAALKHARCIGDNPDTFPDTHGSPLLGMAFTALGAAADPQALRDLFDANRWHFALSHCPDGTFYYQPNRDNNAQDFHAAPRLSATAATALILCLERRSLEMTKRAKPVE